MNLKRNSFWGKKFGQKNEFLVHHHLHHLLQVVVSSCLRIPLQVRVGLSLVLRANIFGDLF